MILDRRTQRPASPRGERGLTMIELIIGIAIMALVLALGMPSISQWLSNSQIRTAAEGVLAGLQLARGEAVRRNQNVRFQLVSTLTSGCAVSTSGTHWVVGLADPTAKCNIAPSDTTAPQTIQIRDGTETPKAVLAATGAALVTFTGSGRPSGSTYMTQVDITNPTGGVCEHVTAGSPMRCLRIIVTSGGRIKMCDPKVSDTTDPRYCA